MLKRTLLILGAILVTLGLTLADHGEISPTPVFADGGPAPTPPPRLPWPMPTPPPD